MNNLGNNPCDNCGTVQVGPPTFAIGAKLDDETMRDVWCVVEGTGRFVCPACYPAEADRARRIFDRMRSGRASEGK